MFGRDSIILSAGFSSNRAHRRLSSVFIGIITKSFYERGNLD
ncbi:15522_t:CDS:1, partial [Gigaspora margarita]